MNRSILPVILLLSLAFGQSPPWQQIDDLNEAKDFDAAYALLAPLQGSQGESVGYLWRMARHHFNNSDNSSDAAVIETEIRAGFAFAKRALAADTLSSDAHGWYGIMIGRVGEIEGTKQKIENSYFVRDHTLRAIELDPQESAWTHVMGQWNYKLADLSWFERTVASVVYAKPPKATFEAARDFFAKAAQDDPQDIRHWVWMGKSEIQLGAKAAARQALEQALTIEAGSEGDRNLQAEARDLLSGL